MNNRDRQRKAKRERMDPVTCVKIKRPDGHYNVYPLRFLAPAERADFLLRATSPLDGVCT